MNLEGQLSVIDFTTLARVKALAGESIPSTNVDAVISTLIKEISATFVEFMGLHALLAERTETYEVRRFAKALSLDAKPISPSAVFTLKYGADTETSSFVTWTASEYAIQKAAGWVRLFSPTPYKPGYFRVTYSGGLAVDTASLIAAFPRFASACDRQVVYALTRRDSLGGNVTIPGGGSTSFATGEYGLLKDVEKVLATHRRAA